MCGCGLFFFLASILRCVRIGSDARKREALAELLQYAEAIPSDGWDVDEDEQVYEYGLEMSMREVQGPSIEEQPAGEMEALPAEFQLQET
jgi:hypothetical protein